MKYMMAVFVAALVGLASAECPVSPANSPSAYANHLSVNKLSQFLRCEPSDPLNDQSPCNTFASRGLYAVYGVKDFMVGENEYLTANQMWDKVTSLSSKWVKLGAVFDSNNNLCAQSIANNGWPVIALMRGSPHGHVALVIPGEPGKAMSWGIMAANSASFFFNKPASAYISLPLNHAYNLENAKNAVFFYRKP